ncbi:MFS transporter [Cellulosimicrobium composti]|uniref:MFS transporter n=1 Tax=Cellulosimicrobium composti TaxID=2672572 RepID=UPI001939F04E|nr:MFS transporter [Cellulosimicrobium composti]
MPLPALLSRPARTTPDRSPWRALRHRSMRWWSGANLVSNVGAWMQLTVQNLLVLELTGSAALTGLSLAVQSAPALLLGVAGGAVVDRWPRKLTAAVSQAVLGVVALTTAGLVALDLLSLPVLLVLSAVTGLVATVDGPATALLGNDLVPVEDVPSAIGIGSVVHSAGRLVGVAVAGGAVAVAGPAVAYLANGVSLLAVALVVPFLVLHPDAGSAAPRPAEATSAGRDTASAPVEPRPAAARAARDAATDGRTDGGGLRYVLGRPRLVALLGVTAVSAVLGRNYTLTLAVLVTGALAGGPQEFGTVSTVLAVGGIVGAVLAGRLRRPTVRLVGVLAAAGALLQVVAGLAPTLAVLLLVVGPMAVVESVSDTAGTTVLQTDPPPHMRGRVLGVWRSASTAWGLAGPPLLGLLMEVLGPRGALVVGGAVVVVAVGAGWLRHHLLARRSARPAGRAPGVPAPAASVLGPDAPATPSAVRAGEAPLPAFADTAPLPVPVPALVGAGEPLVPEHAVASAREEERVLTPA